LLGFKDHPFRRASNGAHGSSKKQHGANGGDEVARVPIGTVIRDRETGDVLADLAADGDRWLAAEGGQGGKGNARFLSNKRRAPAFAEQGEVGEEEWFNAELKLLADVALVGFPNAGKSTFISVISAAKPKIANYPFTTLVPNLGVVRRDEHEFVVADIPGLIEGASEGRGLGHQFLRHIERARVLAVLIDLAPLDGMEPAEQERVLLAELGDYQPDLLDRPRLVIGTKTDIATHDGPLISMSSVTGDGVRAVVGRLGELVRDAREVEAEERSFVLHRPEAKGVVVERDFDGAWIVRGRDAVRAVALSDLTDIEALDMVQTRLDRLGVPKALVRAGVSAGEVVRIGSFEFTYESDDAFGEDDDEEFGR
jgi:GTP-binding protein